MATLAEVAMQAHKHEQEKREEAGRQRRERQAEEDMRDLWNALGRVLDVDRNGSRAVTVTPAVPSDGDNWCRKMPTAEVEGLRFTVTFGERRDLLLLYPCPRCTQEVADRVVTLSDLGRLLTERPGHSGECRFEGDDAEKPADVEDAPAPVPFLTAEERLVIAFGEYIDARIEDAQS